MNDVLDIRRENKTKNKIETAFHAKLPCLLVSGDECVCQRVLRIGRGSWAQARPPRDAVYVALTQEHVSPPRVVGHRFGSIILPMF